MASSWLARQRGHRRASPAPASESEERCPRPWKGEEQPLGRAESGDLVADSAILAAAESRFRIGSRFLAGLR